MAAAVLDVELSDGFRDIDVSDRYNQAFLILRYGGIPVGHLWITPELGRITAARLERQALPAALPALSRRWLERQQPAKLPERLPRVTVAICTRERPEDLAHALDAITADVGDRHDVLVVDNRPVTPRTSALVGRFPRVRYVREDTPGLNAARNRALREAVTPVVAFSDDDATPERGWADALAAGFDHPLVLGVTGLTLPKELETDAQVWFERASPFGRGYFRREFEPLEASPHAAGQVGAGANMAIRRDALDLVGGFDERLDAGTPTRSGGDHEMFARILERGYRLVYDPRAVSRHRHRRTWAELRDTLYGYGVGVYATWTGDIVERRRIAVLRQAALWMGRGQLPALARAVFRRRGAMPLDLVLAELQGCAAGPAAWLASNRHVRKAGRA